MFATFFWLAMGLLMFGNAGNIENEVLSTTNTVLGVLYVLAGAYSGWSTARK